MPRSAHTSAMVSLSRSRRPRTSSRPGMTAPASRPAAPVVRRRPPNRPAQPITHGDTPSGWWEPSRTGFFDGNLSWSWGGSGPGGGRRTVGPCVPRSDKTQVWARCPCNSASWRGTAPQVMRQFLIHAGKALLILPVPWAFSPAPSATLCWLLHPQCSQDQSGANHRRKPWQGGTARGCPWLSVIVRR